MLEAGNPKKLSWLETVFSVKPFAARSRGARLVLKPQRAG
jgi:hypothetical protein